MAHLSSSLQSPPTRQRIDGKLAKDMIPLSAYRTPKTNGRGFLSETPRQMAPRERQQRGLPRLNSAPELYRSELPPIQRRRSAKNQSTEKSKRPLTPVAKLRRSTLASSKSLPRNYRINLDLTPLIEVGTCAGINTVPNERNRLTSIGSDLAQSTESLTSSGSPRINRSLSSSSKAECTHAGHESPRSRSTTSTPDSSNIIRTDSPVEAENGKDKMIIRWLQTIQIKSNEAITPSELLPSIKEGRIT